MKLQFIKVPLILVLLSTMSLTGCLKDDEFNSGQTQAFTGSTTQVISLGINVLGTNNFAAIPISDGLTDTVVDFVPVELGGPTNAGSDIQVTVDTSAALVDSMNNADGSDFVIPTGVTIVNNVVTIKKGTRIGYLQISFVPHTQIGLDVAMGFKITNISPAGYTLSGNYGTGIVSIVIKNKYDGKYNLREYMAGWAAYGIADGVTNSWPSEVIFASTGSASNSISTAEGGLLQTAFTSSNGITVFGNAQPVYNFDPVSNKLLSIDNPAQDARLRAFTPIDSLNSRWDPATGTLYLGYLMTQTGRPPQTIKDTLTYVGPR